MFELRLVREYRSHVFQLPAGLVNTHLSHEGRRSPSPGNEVIVEVFLENGDRSRIVKFIHYSYMCMLSKH